MATAEPSVFSASENSVASGSLWTVSVQPSFADQIFEASHLLTRPTVPASTVGGTGSKAAAAAVPPSEFAVALKQKAVQAQGEAPSEEEPVEGEEARERLPNPDTKEVKEAKRKVVEELWTKVQPGCFNRADDRELDAVNNLLLSLLITYFPHSSEELRRPATQLLEAVASTEGRSTPFGRYNALVTLFNALPAPLPSQGSSEPPLQLSILLRLASLAKTHADDLSIVAPSLLRLPSYLSTWALVGSSVGGQAVAEVASTLSAGGRAEDAFAVALAYLRSAGAASEPVASIAVNLALSLPDFFDWDVLESLEPVKSYLASSNAKSQASLLHALKAGDAKAASAALSSSEHDAPAKERIEKKAKLVALAELCAPRVGGEVKYEEIKERLGLASSIEEDDGMEVEEWVINAIKARLIAARLHQPTHVVYVTSCPSRHFGPTEWSLLQSHLSSWSASLDSLVSTVERSLPAGQKSHEGEKALEEKEEEARRVKGDVVKQVEEEVKTAPPTAEAGTAVAA